MQFLRILYLILLLIVLPSTFLAQTENIPDPTLESPYNTIFVHLYFLQPETYQPEIAALTIPETDSLKATTLAIKLKQILDGRGLYIYLNLLPQQNDFIDSLSQKAFYTPFPQKQPEIYLEKIKHILNIFIYRHVLCIYDKTRPQIEAIHKTKAD